MSTQNFLKREIETRIAKDEFNLFTSSLSTQSLFSPPELFTTDNSGDLTGVNVVWLVDTSSPRNRTLDPYGKRVLVRDTLGSASVNNITITAPSGQTIENDETYIISSSFSWATFYRYESNWFLLSEKEIITTEEVDISSKLDTETFNSFTASVILKEENSPNTISHLWNGTQIEYDNLLTTSSTVLYIITE